MKRVSMYDRQDFLKKYREKVKAHHLVPFPQIIKTLGNLKNKSVLDIGCGSGELTTLIAKKAKHTVGIDRSKEWIALCKNTYQTNHNLRFILADGAKLPFENSSFDMIVMNMVLLNVETKNHVQRIFNEAARVLKPGGTLIFSDLHPICMMTQKLFNRRQSYSKGFSYFKDGGAYTAHVALLDGTTIAFKNMHWTLETLTSFICASGFSISQIIEPTYSANAPKEFRRYNIPEYLLLSCKKLS